MPANYYNYSYFSYGQNQRIVTPSSIMYTITDNIKLPDNYLPKAKRKWFMRSPFDNPLLLIAKYGKDLWYGEIVDYLRGSYVGKLTNIPYSVEPLEFKSITSLQLVARHTKAQKFLLKEFILDLTKD